MARTRTLRASKTPLTAFAFAAFAVAFAACGAPAASPGATATATATLPPAGGSPSAAPGSPAAGFSGNACDLLSDADILTTTGVPVASKGPATLAYANNCEWKLATVDWTIELGVDPNGGVTEYDRLVQVEGGGDDLPFLGDRAIVLKTSHHPIAQLGSTLFDLQFVGTGELPDTDVRLLDQVVRNAGSKGN
jgi:hypothetical protein